VVPVSFDELTLIKPSEHSAQIRERVIKARIIQTERYKDYPEIYCNAQMTSKLIHEYCAINHAGTALLKIAMSRLNLSARAYDRILKVSRTIADLADCDEIRTEHLAEAIHYRSLDRENWAG
jgi:magnesium chelatase family protein